VNVLPTLAPLLPTHAARPSVARVTVSPADDSQGFSGSPTVDWHLHPLPPHEMSTVEVNLASRGQPRADWNDARPWRDYERARPHTAAFTGLVWRNGRLEVFGATPATDLAYLLLHDDLKTLRWVS